VLQSFSRAEPSDGSTLDSLVPFRKPPTVTMRMSSEFVREADANGAGTRAEMQRSRFGQERKEREPCWRRTR
jgi:hypothetical protein